MPTIDCALGSAPVGEVEDKKSGFLVILVFTLALLKSLLFSRPGKKRRERAVKEHDIHLTLQQSRKNN